MTKDGTNAPSCNTNAKQIGSERARAPTETPQKDYFEVYIEIITTLLKNEVRSETEIADDCGYAKEGKDKCAHVHRQINKLVSKWNYIEYSDGPRPGYRIRRDLETICHIYDDKHYESIRPDFQESPWLTDLINGIYLPEYRGDGEFLEDLKKMLKTSRWMFEWYLRNTTHAHHTATLGEILGPSIPVEKTPGINEPLLEWLTRKCVFYDQFISCMWLEYDGALKSKTLPEETLRIFDEMKQKSAQGKLKAINYILSFAITQNLAQCADVIRDNDGQVPLFFEDLVKNFNKIAEHMSSDNIDQESLMMAAKEMGDLYNRISKSLGDSSPLNSVSGVIKGIGPKSKIIMEQSVKGS
ncbi:MAG: hypothetical protein WAK75_08080 [Methanoregula sp.]|uniref:hypothetical protein n=1 Tax=Methanoregula sp. TaxID=2052170 RepID=UPI003BAF912F